MKTRYFLLSRSLLAGLLMAALPGRASDPPGATPSPTAPGDTSRVRQPHRRPVFQFDQRYSLLEGKLVGINGIKLGVEWRGRLRTGLGLYFLSSAVPTDAPTPEFVPLGSTDQIRFRYAALYGEYVLIGTPRWELSTPVQVGLGRYYVRYEYPDGTFYRTPKKNIWLVEPTLGGHMRVFRWVGLGVGAGYRQAIFTEDKLEDDISGVIFYGRVKLFLGDLYKIVRGRQPLFTQQGLRREDWQPR